MAHHRRLLRCAEDMCVVPYVLQQWEPALFQKNGSTNTLQKQCQSSSPPLWSPHVSCSVQFGSFNLSVFFGTKIFSQRTSFSINAISSTGAFVHLCLGFVCSLWFDAALLVVMNLVLMLRVRMGLCFLVGDTTAKGNACRPKSRQTRRSPA